MERLNTVEKQNNINESSVAQKIKKLFAMSKDWSLSEDGDRVVGVRKEVSLANNKDMLTSVKDGEGNMVQTSKENLEEYVHNLNIDEKEILNQIGYLDYAFLKGAPEGDNYKSRIYIPLKEPIKKSNLDVLPQEIILGEEEFKTNPEGKKYKYEKGGVYYGGDYLNETSQEIDLNLPEQPEEKNSIM